MEILARAIPEPLGKLAEWRELSERLKIEGKVQGLRCPSRICVGFLVTGEQATSLLCVSCCCLEK